MTQPPGDKSSAVDDAITAAQKKHGDGVVGRYGAAARVWPCVPTGSWSLDRALGIGGYPRGRIIELYGPEMSGKTTLTLHALAMCQAAGLTVAFVDAEHALDPKYAARIGVKMKDLVISQPDNGEQALDIVESLARSGGVGAIAVDSVAALVPQAELIGDMGDSHIGLQARLMSQALRKLTAVCAKTQTTIFFINQLRMKIGVVFGSPEVTTGGNALKFYASVRLDVRRKDKLNVGGELVGHMHRIKVAKNKLAPPFKEVFVNIIFGKGVDRVNDLVEVALDLGVVEQRSSWFYMDESKLCQGRFNLNDLVRADTKVFNKVRKACVSKCKYLRWL